MTNNNKSQRGNIMAIIKNNSWWIQPVITLAILIGGFAYTNGQTSEAIRNNSDKIRSQEQVVKEFSCAVQKLEIVTAELKTELRLLRGNK
jgi:hypothetical protein